MVGRIATTDVHETEVLIVGAGPTGLVAANLLGQVGIRALLIEQSPALSSLPKALMVDDEFFRLLHRIGLGDALASHGVFPVDYDYFSPLGPRVGHIAGRITENGFPSRTATFQPEFEQILYRGINRFPTVQTLFGCELISFLDGDVGIEALVRGAAGAHSHIRAAYLIGADGSHSVCRKALGIPFEELAPVEVRHVVVDVADDPNESKTADLRLGWRRNANSLPTPGGRRRYEFSLQQAKAPKRCCRKLRSIGYFDSLSELTVRRRLFVRPCMRFIRVLRSR
jgi:3-(3-hydroxy-phenyl)propionate hydroxylase